MKFKFQYKFWFSIVLITGCLAITGLSAAENVDIFPGKDNTLYFSDSGSLSNGSGMHFFVGLNNASEVRRGVIAFDVAGNIPPGATIDSVVLTLHMSRTSAGPAQISIHRLTSDWGEGASDAGGQEGGGAPASNGDATWIHTSFPSIMWNSPGGDFSGTSSASAMVDDVGDYTWGPTPNMTADVQEWLNNPQSNFGWILIGPEGSRSTKRFDSKENQTAGLQPVLTVTYTPPAQPVPSFVLYYPHVASDGVWDTEISAINLGTTMADGSFTAHNDEGMQVSTPIDVSLAPGARREITVGSEFTAPSTITWLAFETDSPDVVGYVKFFIAGQFRVGIPAVSKVNTGDIFVPHIASDPAWATGLSLVNTTGSVVSLNIEFNSGEMLSVDIPAKGHRAFTVRELFNGTMKPNIKSAIIKNGAGVIGLELFSSTPASGNNYLSGTLLKDILSLEMNYPHVIVDNFWSTGVVAFNPSASETANLTITPYTAAGIPMADQMNSIGPMEKFDGTPGQLGLPEETDWFSIRSDRGITGFELFATNNGFQLGGFTAVGLRNKSGVFPKIDMEGATGIAFVNSEDGDANVSLFAMDNSGVERASSMEILGPFEKRVKVAQEFFNTDISAATYIKYESDREIVGFQLNSSGDGMLLDAIPALSSTDTVEIIAENFRFDADNDDSSQIDTVTINQGDTVRWIWREGSHTVTSGSGSAAPNAGSLFEAPLNSQNTVFSFTFMEAGTFEYFCRPHEGQNMKGVINVQ